MASVSNSNNTETAPDTHKSAKAVLRALIFFLFIGLIIFLWWFFFRKGIVVTDDAYVTGNIIRLSPQTGGTVIEILADTPQTVSEGDVLVRLDRADVEIELAEAWSALKLALQTLTSQVKEKERLEAVILATQSSLELSQADLERRQKLKSGSSITQEELTRYEAQVKINLANLEAARASLEALDLLLGKAPLQSHPTVLERVARLRAAHLKLARTEIKSPVTGKVAKRSVQLGAQVSPGSPILIIVPTEQVWVEANFKESQLKNMHPGQAVKVTVDMYGRNVIYDGVVEGLSAGTGSVFSLLPAENATGNWIKIVQRVPVRISLDVRQLAKHPLILGLSCQVSVNLNEESNLPENTWTYHTQSLTVDETALNQEIERTIAEYLR
ncbi:MAG: HlyD family efflux transporter periplasmic adaptor subunit [Deltaproteobacteria bacterium]|jgi:membrane fusion protein (multidrug efflux system)|nr:HlyD family efflux transporter periplasmic adaptor subunit [Deltaproteobacteria bacterium]